MADYIHSEQNGVHIFDLVQTKALLDEVLEMFSKASKEGKSILLVGTKKQAKDLIEKYAKEAGVFYVSERWLGGTLTNFEHIKKSARKLVDTKKGLEQGEFAEYTKKERVLLEREIARLERFFGGIVGLETMPDYIFIVDIKKESSAAKEARMKGVVSVGLADTNSDPEAVDWAIPMNDDATKVLDYVLQLIRDAVLEGKAVNKESGIMNLSESETLPSRRQESSINEKKSVGKEGGGVKRESGIKKKEAATQKNKVSKNRKEETKAGKKTIKK